MSSRAEEKEARRAERLEREAAEARRERARRRLRMLALALGVAAVVVVAAIVVSRSSDPGPSAGERDASGLVGAAETAAMLRGIPQDGTALGDRNAPVTLTEYADLQCPFCREYALGVLPDLVERYVRTGKVRLELRLLRFVGPDSAPAAQAAVVAADRGRYWNFTDLFYRNQGEENSGYVDDAFLGKLAAAIPGLTPAAIRDGASAPGIERRLAGFEREAATTGVSSTPTFRLARRGQAAKPFAPAELETAAFAAAIDPLLPASK